MAYAPGKVVRIGSNAGDLGERLLSSRKVVRRTARSEALEGGGETEHVLVRILVDEGIAVPMRSDALEVLAKMKVVSDSGDVVDALRSVLWDGSVDLRRRCAAGCALAKRIGDRATEDLVALLDSDDRRVQAEVLWCMAAFCGDSVWERVFDLLRESFAEKSPARMHEVAVDAIQYLALNCAPGSQRLVRLAAELRANWARLAPGERQWIAEDWTGLQPCSTVALGEPPREKWRRQVRCALVPDSIAEMPVHA
jgi:hypothetical protein